MNASVMENVTWLYMEQLAQQYAKGISLGI